jgi:hypothetical protein
MNIREIPLIRKWMLRRDTALGRSTLPATHTQGIALSKLIPLIFVMTLAVVIRIWNINQIGYNSDEAVYAGQAAAIAQAPILKDIFPVFRAHPLLFQFVLALIFQFGVSDVGGRLLSVVIGVATIYIVYRLGSLIYGRNTGLLAALFLAVMPYHVVVTRQVLLDGPLVLCSTLTLYLLARFSKTGDPVWIHATGMGMGLTFLAKETGIILLGAIYAFLALTSEIRVRIKDLALSIALMAIMISPFPVSLWLSGVSRTGKQYFIWQLFRRPNHTWDFYLTVVPIAIGILVILLAILGIWLLRKERTWREKLLIAWILVPVIFFQIWPTKGFQYLLPIAPAMALLASRTLVRWYAINKYIFLFGRRLSTSYLKSIMTTIVVLTLMISSLQSVQIGESGTFIAGTGGVPGGRETGIWLRENVPAGATLLTIGPSMANIIQFYGYHKAYGLSVSLNPLHRNPSYEPVTNPDYLIRSNEIQYLVWDSYSAERSVFFSDKLIQLAMRFNGRVAHTESITITTEDGIQIEKPVIIIYKVHP